MMRLKYWLVYLSIALNIFFFGTYIADRLLPLPSGGQPGAPAMLYESLDLTSSQRAFFEAERDRFHGKMIDARRHIQSRQSELLQLLAAQNPDRAAINSKKKQILNLQSKLQGSVISHLLDVCAHLDPKQRESFFALLKGRMARQGPGYPPGCY